MLKRISLKDGHRPGMTIWATSCPVPIKRKTDTEQVNQSQPDRRKFLKSISKTMVKTVNAGMS
jgi:hypothetical protein